MGKKIVPIQVMIFKFFINYKLNNTREHRFSYQFPKLLSPKKGALAIILVVKRGNLIIGLANLKNCGPHCSMFQI
jgi:hypothetical protein